MGDTAVVFPGQGAQVVGMGRDAAEASPRARRVFERAAELLGFDVAGLCFDGPADELARTDIQQPAIFVTSVALWEAYLEAGGTRDRFARTGGLSLGEYTALHVAGAMDFDHALRLVRRRGELMQEAALATPSGMVSLIGGDEPSAAALCDKVRQDDVLAAANFNCPGQVVISGSRGACERAVACAGEFGFKAVPLPVAGAFHSPLMAPAAEGLAAVLAETPFSTPEIPVVANTDAEYHADAAAIRDALRRQLTQPVLWQRCMERLMADGVDRVVEVGPGRALTGMMRKINRLVPASAVNSMAAVAEAVA